MLWELVSLGLEAAPRLPHGYGATLPVLWLPIESPGAALPGAPDSRSHKKRWERRVLWMKKGRPLVC